MKKLFLFLLILLLLNFAVAEQLICIDFDAPSAPSNLTISGEVGNVILTWNVATDEPNCSGIDYYVVSRDGINLGNTTLLTYTDTEDLAVGSYNYTVFAVDKVGHQEGQSIKNEITITPTNEGGGSGGGSGGGGGGSGKSIVVGGNAGSSYVCTENWVCEDWGKCENEEQTRICTDISQCGTSIKKPATSQTCKNETISSNNFLTGGAIQGLTDFVTSQTGYIWIIGGIAGVIVLVVIIKKAKKKKKEIVNQNP